MSPSDAARALEELARELDLVVYRLERPPGPPREPVPDPLEALKRERIQLRRELDALRERLEDVARGLDG